MKSDKYPHISEMFEKYGLRQHYDAGTALKFEGDTATDLCYIIKGEVRAFVSSPDGDEMTLFYVGAGNMIFSEALMTDKPVIIRNSVCSTAVDLYSMNARMFWEIWQDEKYPMQELIAHFIERFKLLHEYICCAHFHESAQRVAYLLYMSSKRGGGTVNYTHEQIAAITGTNRVSVSRILASMAKEGIVTLGYKHIKLNDPAALAAKFNALGLHEQH